MSMGPNDESIVHISESQGGSSWAVLIAIVSKCFMYRSARAGESGQPIGPPQVQSMPRNFPKSFDQRSVCIRNDPAIVDVNNISSVAVCDCCLRCFLQSYSWTLHQRVTDIPGKDTSSMLKEALLKNINKKE